jgi:hypothetical protein
MTSGLASRGSHRFTMATGAPEERKAELSASGGGVGEGLMAAAILRGCVLALV